MTDDAWERARLIPTSGITGADEQERRGTSALLAVIASVKEFGRELTRRFGAPAGAIETFIEVPFERDGHRLYPDGLIRVTRGQRTWVALLEVKTGKNQLNAEQLETYLDIAKEHAFDTVMTISNELATVPGVHPTPIGKRKLGKVALNHLSWSQIHTEAIMAMHNRTISDPDQAWILSELIRYLEHPKSGAIDFDDMGRSWVAVREAVRAGTLLASDPGAANVADKWEQLIQFIGMRLGRRLGVDVQPTLSRRDRAEPALRLQAQTASLVSSSTLRSGLKIPNAAAALEICADLNAGRISCSLDVAAPRKGKPRTRVNWLLRQLKEAPDDLRIDVFTAWSRGATRSELLRNVRAAPRLLVEDESREITKFRIGLGRTAGTKRGQGKGTFVSSVLDLVDGFYVDVVQRIKPWTEGPPKLDQTAINDVDATPLAEGLHSSNAEQVHMHEDAATDGNGQATDCLDSPDQYTRDKAPLVATDPLSLGAAPDSR